MLELAIAYRVYPGISKHPALFPTDKLKLSEICLRSFQRALGRLRVKIWVLLDGCPPEYESLFRETLAQHKLEIIRLNGLGNLGTFSLQIDLLIRQKEAEFVYFAEDDYFYLPGAIETMVGFMRENRDADFVTAYDHPDSYSTSSKHERHAIRPWGDRYWRTASSTCLTFLTSRDTLRCNENVFRSYCAGNHDCSLWLALTQKLELLRPRVHLCDSLRLKIWIKAWFWGWRRILLGRRYRLWAPLPTLSTHLESTCLSPLVDWQNEFRKLETSSAQPQ